MHNQGLSTQHGRYKISTVFLIWIQGTKNPMFLTLLFLIVLSLNSCIIERIAIRSSTAILKNTALAINEEEDLDIAEKAIASQLKMLEGMIKSDPGNHEIILLATRGFCSYAFSFIEDYDKEKAKIFYKRGLNYGLQFLSAKKSYADALEKGGKALQLELDKTDGQDVPLLFWTAYCWGSLINLSRNSPEALSALPKVEKMMKRVLELNEGYYFGSVCLYFGVFYGSLPPMLGGKPEKSKYYFERALEVAQGKFLMAYVLYAKSFAIQTQDKNFFKQLLNHVINSPPDILPTERLANNVARLKAKKLLEDINEYF